MSLAPLPDVFGNYAIKGIAEVIPPEPVAWIPHTAGWKVLGAFAVLLLLRLLLSRYRTWRGNRYRRVALGELRQAEQLEPDVALGRLAAILKSTALAAFPRDEVASLSGEQWLQWLASTTDTVVFGDNSRELIVESQYRRPAGIDREAVRVLVAEVADWIRLHRGVTS